MTPGLPRGLLRRLTSVVRLKGGDRAPAEPWRPETGAYPRLLALDEKTQELTGIPGLYLLWHLGVRPQWLRAGFTRDLGMAVKVLAATPKVVACSVHDGPFVSWRPCEEQDALALVNSLVARLSHALQPLSIPCDVPPDPAVPPVRCPLPRGTREIGGD